MAAPSPVGDRQARSGAVALGGFLGFAGALARYAVDRLLDGGRRSTLVVNVLGAVVAASPSVTTLVGTGFCGAFTTFSSFVFNVTRALETGRADPAIADAVGTLIAALVGVALGSALAGL